MSTSLTELRRMLDTLLEGRSLPGEEARALFAGLTHADTPPPLAGALLAALRAKGVTGEELRGFASACVPRRCVRRSSSAARAVDIVGTGGDKSGSFNLSTGAALLAAAAGQPVIKHGNRSVSSRAGSADVLEALGLALPLDERRAGEFFERTGFTFLFAPHYHPSTKAIATGPRRARRAHGVQHPRPAEQPGRAGLSRHRRVRPAHRAADGRRAVGAADRARVRRARRRWLGRADTARAVRAVRRAARQRAAERTHAGELRPADVRGVGSARRRCGLQRALR